MEDSVGLNMMLMFILKTLLPNCPSCLRALLSIFLDEATFCTNISGQVWNQLPQQNGNPMQDDRMQNLAGAGGGGAGIPLSGSPANIFAMDQELQRPRLNMLEKIFEIISQLLPKRVVNEAHQKQKLKDIFKRIREGLFNSAQTNDEYINQNTLGSCLSNLIEQPTGSSHNQRHVHLVTSSSSVGTMIPTPRMSHSGNSNLMASSVDTAMVFSAGIGSMAPTVNAGTMLPTGGIYGILPKEYERSPANFAISTLGSVSAMSEQRTTSKMIPIPGFNDYNNSHSCLYMESSNNGGGHSSVESIVVSQPEQQKQFVGGKNSLILQTPGSQMSSNLTPMMQQRPYCFPDGGIEMIANDMLLLNEPAGAEFESNLMNEVSAETIETVYYQEEYEAQLTQVFCFGEESGRPEPCDLSASNASRMWEG